LDLLEANNACSAEFLMFLADAVSCKQISHLPILIKEVTLTEGYSEHQTSKKEDFLIL
jgi:hypothetical protein